MGLIGGIDHVVIAVRGLDDAYSRYAHLGFTLTPRGTHTQLDTANHTIMFPDMTYFEVLGVTRPGVKNAFYADFVRQREGVAGIALKADDARAVEAALKDAPFYASDAIDFARPVDMPQGRAEARFTVTQFDPVGTPGARFFACQHYTPDVVWRRDMLTHANGALGLKSVTIVVRDPLEAARRYEALFEAKLQRLPDRLEIATGTCVLKLMTPAAFAERYPGDPVARIAPPFCAALAFKVVDPVTTDMALRARGVATRNLRDGTVVVGSVDACGTVLTFG